MAGKLTRGLPSVQTGEREKVLEVVIGRSLLCQIIRPFTLPILARTLPDWPKGRALNKVTRMPKAVSILACVMVEWDEINPGLQLAKRVGYANSGQSAFLTRRKACWRCGLRHRPG